MKVFSRGRTFGLVLAALLTLSGCSGGGEANGATGASMASAVSGAGGAAGSTSPTAVVAGSESGTGAESGSGKAPAIGAPPEQTAPVVSPAEQTAPVAPPPQESGSGSEPVPVPSAPAPLPTVRLVASDYAINAGEAVTLDWSATDADSCMASGGWAGARPVSGRETVGPLQSSTTFTLNCSGAGGTAMAMLTISVTVNGTVVLRWQAPTRNVDGTPITALQAYRIYYGSFSGQYTDYEQISPDIQGTYSFYLPRGEYFIAMTAIGPDGQESAYSNEVYRVVQ